MKKKIKDITFFDLNEICLKAVDCDTCPLHIPDKNDVELCLVSQLIRYSCNDWGKIIEQEVEV